MQNMSCIQKHKVSRMSLMEQNELHRCFLKMYNTNAAKIVQLLNKKWLNKVHLF